LPAAAVVWLVVGLPCCSVSGVDAARPGETTMDWVAGPVVTGQVDLADAARSGEAAVKRVGHAVRRAADGGVTDRTHLAPDADADDRHGHDDEDGDPAHADTRCGLGARGGCGDLRCHDRAPWCGPRCRVCGAGTVARSGRAIDAASTPALSLLYGSGAKPRAWPRCSKIEAHSVHRSPSLLMGYVLLARTPRGNSSTVMSPFGGNHALCQ